MKCEERAEESNHCKAKDGEKEEGEEGSASEAVETTARRTNEGARLGVRHED